MKYSVLQKKPQSRIMRLRENYRTKSLENFTIHSCGLEVLLKKNQYNIVSLFVSNTSRHRSPIDSTKYFNVESGILFHSSTINRSNSPKFCGIRLSTLRLTIAHRFSIG